MTCKDCLHCEVCDFWEAETYNVDPAEWDGQICKFFKANTFWAKVPCTIGQPVWRLITWFSSPPEIVEGKVSMIQQKVDKSWKIRISTVRYGTYDLKAGDIGEDVFFTKEAAEEALLKITNVK